MFYQRNNWSIKFVIYKKILERSYYLLIYLLAKLNKETYQKIMQPRMLSGHFQGRVLSMLSKIIHPTTILEVGTYTGYATLCLAEGLAENGTIDTADKMAAIVNRVRTR
jgi:predicted O-methyltransferase YrrM